MCHCSCINLQKLKSDLEVSRAGCRGDSKLTNCKQGCKCAMMEIRREKVHTRPKTKRTQEKFRKRHNYSVGSNLDHL